MSPPIRNGSGNSIGSIRLGDGSEISEVRTGAGDVLFSAIDAEDFESGSISSNWKGDIGELSAQQSFVIAGSYSGKFGPVGSSADKSVSYTFDKTTVDFSNKLRFDVKSRYTVIEIQNSGTKVTNVYFHVNSKDMYVDGPSGNSNQLATINADTNYKIDFVFDFANDQYDLILDGSTLGTFDFLNSVSGYDTVRYRQDHNGTSTNSLYLDDLVYG